MEKKKKKHAECLQFFESKQNRRNARKFSENKMGFSRNFEYKTECSRILKNNTECSPIFENKMVLLRILNTCDIHFLFENKMERQRFCERDLPDSQISENITDCVDDKIFSGCEFDDESQYSRGCEIMARRLYVYNVF